MSAPERIPPQPAVTGETPSGAPVERVEGVLAEGRLAVRGRIVDASNAVLFAVAELDGRRVPCVYKPVAGERPLWDFPHGTLARREVAAYEVSRALGWDLVPPTVLRDGPHGEGMCQLWVGPRPDAGDAPEEGGAPEDAGDARDAGDATEAGDAGDAAEAGSADRAAGDELLALVDAERPAAGWKAVGFAEVGEGRTALLVHADDARLRRVAALDAVINNADRKGGHLLPLADGRLYGIDHGVTFHADDKLRTLLWGWAGEPLPDADLAALRGFATELADAGPLAARLAELLSPEECAALRERTAALLRTGRYPLPSGEWPAIPWPLV